MAKLPVAFVVTVLQRGPLVQEVLPLIDQPWQFTSSDYHAWFREHPRWLAADATPLAIDLAGPSDAIMLPLPVSTPIYQAELAGAYLSSLLAPRNTTVYVDNVAALVNAHKGVAPSGSLSIPPAPQQLPMGAQ